MDSLVMHVVVLGLQCSLCSAKQQHRSCCTQAAAVGCTIGLHCNVVSVAPVVLCLPANSPAAAINFPPASLLLLLLFRSDSAGAAG
jgi:hypothetical protein